MDEPMPWDRRPDESEEAHEALRTYLDLRGERSHVATAAKLGKSVALINRWSSRDDWAVRTAAFDAHEAAIDRKARERVRAREAAKWEARRLAELEANYQDSKALRDKLRSMLKMALTRKRTGDNGETIIEPARWTMANVPTFARMAADLAAQAIAEALEDDFDPATATAEEARAYLQRLADRRDMARQITDAAGGTS